LYAFAHVRTVPPAGQVPGPRDGLLANLTALIDDEF
jgi:hypothetical protein